MNVNTPIHINHCTSGKTRKVGSQNFKGYFHYLDDDFGVIAGLGGGVTP